MSDWSSDVCSSDLPGQPSRLALGDVTAPAQLALASADAQPVPVETVRPADIAPAMETQVTMAALEPAAPLIKADIPAASIPAPRLASVTRPPRANNVSGYVVRFGDRRHVVEGTGVACRVTFG